jgi:hypothetical protein
MQLMVASRGKYARGCEMEWLKEAVAILAAISLLLRIYKTWEELPDTKSKKLQRRGHIIFYSIVLLLLVILTCLAFEKIKALIYGTSSVPVILVMHMLAKAWMSRLMQRI